MLHTGQDVRRAARTGQLTGQTSGLAPGFTQANLAILPADWAEEFHQFCLANPQPCPLLEVLPPGQPVPQKTAPDADLRTDLPRYRIWKNGELIEEVSDITSHWRDDLVSFLIGCSFTFEAPLQAEHIPIRHIDLGCNVPMFRTNRPCIPAGRFHGPLVVSMRPLTSEHAIRAVQITSQYPAVHGAPVHLGFPEQLGIADINRPDYGDPVPVQPGELPVFWACGVTPQAALQAAKPPFAITHSPGCMFVTDWQDAELSRVIPNIQTTR